MSDLPHHVLAYILGFLPWQDLVGRCALVARAWHHAVHGQCVTMCTVTPTACAPLPPEGAAVRDAVLVHAVGLAKPRADRAVAALLMRLASTAPHVRAIHLDFRKYMNMSTDTHLSLLANAAEMCRSGLVRDVGLRMPLVGAATTPLYAELFAALTAWPRRSLHLAMDSPQIGADAWSAVIHWALHPTHGLAELTLECHEWYTAAEVFAALCPRERSESWGSRLRRLRLCANDGNELNEDHVYDLLDTIEGMRRFGQLACLELTLRHLNHAYSITLPDVMFGATEHDRALDRLVLDTVHSVGSTNLLHVMLILCGPARDLCLRVNSASMSRATWYMLCVVLRQPGWRRVRLHIQELSSFSNRPFPCEWRMLEELGASVGLDLAIQLVSCDGHVVFST